MQQLEQQRRTHDLKLAEMQQEAARAQIAISEALQQVNADHLTFVQATATKETGVQEQFLRLARISIGLAGISALLALVAALQLGYPDGVGFLVRMLPGQPEAVATETPQAPVATSSPSLGSEPLGVK